MRFVVFLPGLHGYQHFIGRVLPIDYIIFELSKGPKNVDKIVSSVYFLVQFYDF